MPFMAELTTLTSLTDGLNGIMLSVQTHFLKKQNIEINILLMYGDIEDLT